MTNYFNRRYGIEKTYEKIINRVFTTLFIISFILACSKTSENQESIEINKKTNLTNEVNTNENNIKKIIKDGAILKEFKNLSTNRIW